MAHNPATEPLDQTDPHHELGHHGHVINTEVRDENNNLLRGMNTGPDGIVAWARKRRIEKIGELASMGLLDLGGVPPEQRYEEEYAIFHHGQGPEHGAAVSDANHT